jgi:phosphohistidine phosphatase
MSMRQLMLMRHAKAAPASRFGTEAEQSDHARPLNAAGHAAAAAMRAAMIEHGLSPDVVLVSSARRTLQTLEELEPWDESPLVEPMDRLYLATAGVILQVLQGVSDTVRSAMVIGHNPGLHDLATQLLGAQAAPAGSAAQWLAAGFPTGALAVFTVPPQWRELGRAWGGPGESSRCRLDRFLRPSELPEATR